MARIALINTTKDLECPPLTLVYLATYIQKHHKAEVKIIDINFEDILKEIKKFKPDIIGISAMTIKIKLAKNFAREIKKFSNAKIVIGGVHITTFPKSFTKEFDIAVLGEGEETFLEIVEAFEEKGFNKKKLYKIKGIMFWESGKIKNTAPRELRKNIDEIPFPDRKLLNRKYFKSKISYNKLRGMKVIESGIITSRGCPYKCAFCSASSFWNKIRFHSPEYVGKEIKYLVETFNVNYLVIYDDFFAISTKRVRDIIQELKKNNILGKVNFSCNARANVITDELCEAMKELGVITVNFGFESGSERILRKLKGENVTVKENLDAVKICRKHGLEVSGSFILGSPGEKLEDMKKTKSLIENMKKLGASELWCGVAVPYPKTKLWEYGVKNNLLKNHNWDLSDPSYPHNHIFLDKSISKKDFLKIFKQIKNISQDINPKKQSKIKRKIKEIIYYDKNLHNLAKKIMEKFQK